MTNDTDTLVTILEKTETTIELTIEELEPRVAPGIDTSPRPNHNETVLADEELTLGEVEELEQKLAPTGGIDFRH